MKEQGYGRIVYTSSAAGIFGNFGQTNYGAAKMGLVGLSNVLAVEGAKNNIQSNVIAPVAKTRMTEELLGDFANELDPELVTPMVAYLASEACTTTHGAFSAAGGRYARVFGGLGQGWYAGKGEHADGRGHPGPLRRDRRRRRATSSRSRRPTRSSRCRSASPA